MLWQFRRELIADLEEGSSYGTGKINALYKENNTQNQAFTRYNKMEQDIKMNIKKM